MRDIFSRKGFDSSAGGGHSPIVDGRPLSLPIPDTKGFSRTTYGDLGLGEYAAQASRGKLGARDLCHHAPKVRQDGTFVFGQHCAAQTHPVPVGPPSLWRRPEWFTRGGLSYHDKPERWLRGGKLQSVARGQEFVADIGRRQAPRDWLESVIAEVKAS